MSDRDDGRPHDLVLTVGGAEKWVVAFFHDRKRPVILKVVDGEHVVAGYFKSDEDFREFSEDLAGTIAVPSPLEK